MHVTLACRIYGSDGDVVLDLVKVHVASDGTTMALYLMKIDKIACRETVVSYAGNSLQWYKLNWPESCI